MVKLLPNQVTAHAAARSSGPRATVSSRILVTLKQLRQDDGFAKLLAAEDLAAVPELKGQYTV